jgi:hypothetical protein
MSPLLLSSWVARLIVFLNSWNIFQSVVEYGHLNLQLVDIFLMIFLNAIYVFLRLTYNRLTPFRKKRHAKNIGICELLLLLLHLPLIAIPLLEVDISPPFFRFSIRLLLFIIFTIEIIILNEIDKEVYKNRPKIP